MARCLHNTTPHGNLRFRRYDFHFTGKISEVQRAEVICPHVPEPVSSGGGTVQQDFTPPNPGGFLPFRSCVSL